MKITSLEIHNIRAVQHIALNELAQVVLIAGPNGCGKSCIFDAIRLLKSLYGGYQPNEWHQWFGEYGINVSGRAASLQHLFRDRSLPIKVSATFELASTEKTYLLNHVHELSERAAWELVAPHTQGFLFRPIARDLREYEPQVRDKAAKLAEDVRGSLTASLQRGEVTVTGSQIHTLTNPLLELLFSTYDPEHIGIIDFHGANRTYAREEVNAINLDLQSTEEQRRQSHLYNSGAKYTNIKSEMASSYVRDLLAQHVNAQLRDKESLTETLKELFKTFFPEKEFLGPVPTNERTLAFPVRIPGGHQHDINDLSSGEKEVLFGYLRLRNSSPRNSVILLDEPEMHLNPGLIRGLPQFYKKHIGEFLNNQLWLVTHSDTFLREAVGQPGFDVFHMQQAAPGTESRNQLKRVQANDEVERAIIDLVGDLATFKPGGPIVIFEGENSDFDVSMTSRLFPELLRYVNPISAGSKTNSRKLHSLLRDASERVGLSGRVFTIVDQDDVGITITDEGVHSWPVYHIENFLLSDEHIFAVLQDISSLRAKFRAPEEVKTALLSAAKETTTQLVRHRLQNLVNDAVIKSIRIEADRNAQSITDALLAAMNRSQEKLSGVVKNELDEHKLRARENELRAELEAALIDGTWVTTFRGRDVLKRFVNLQCGSELKYEVFRDLIIAKMRDCQFQPSGMAKVIDGILLAAKPRTGTGAAN